MAFPLFIAMGIIGILIGRLIFAMFINSKSENINSFLKLSIWIFFIVGAIFFFIMGMFYASYTLSATTYMPKWLAITLVSILLLLIYSYTFKEIKALHNKNVLFVPSDFYNSRKYFNYGQVVNEYVLSAGLVLLPSYIFFLIFNNLADKLSFGLNSFLMSFFN